MKENEITVFEVPGDVLQDRLDVLFYHPRFVKFIEILNKYKNVKTLQNIAKITRILGFETEKYVKYVEKGVPYLRVQNIKEFEIDLTDVKYISEESHKKLKRSQLKPDDIVLTITGRVGTAAVVPKNLGECNASQEIVRIRLQDKTINPHYIAAYLNSKFGALLLERWQSGGSRPRTLIRNIRNIEVPIFSTTIQNKIVTIIQDAIKVKKEKEKQVKNLREVITNILLRQLNVKLPEEKNEKMAFILPASSLTDRLDPEFYTPTYRKFLEAIEKSHLEVKKLGQIAKKIVSGQRPKGGVKYLKEGIPSLGGEHITSNGDFNFDTLRFIPRHFYKALRKSRLEPFDIVMVKDGATTGKVAIVSEDFPFKECSINEHLFKITIKKNDPYYIFSYLFSNLGQKQIRRLMSGAAQKGITQKSIREVKIILPDLNLQNKIAKEVKIKMETFKQLKKEIAEIMKKAKKEIEKIIEEELECCDIFGEH